MEWDVIVVGAGSSGAVIAARLSEDTSRKVLLLESGPDFRSSEAPPEMRSLNPFGILIPEDPELFRRYQWQNILSRRTELQDYRPLKRGRGVGGSSSINGMCAIRGVTEAFDQWASLGCTGWSWNDVLPYFRKLEDDLDYPDEPGHGRGGPIPIFRNPQANWGPVDRALKEAALALGHPWCRDHNAAGATGVACYAMNIRDGARVSTNDAYLEPARNRPNLRIVGDAHVERILFNGRRAVGVSVRRGAESVRFEGREIVLASGAVHSPAILMRSGIGDPAVLRDLGIEPVAAIPGVGSNLFDHPVVRIEFLLKEPLRVKDRNFRHTNCCLQFSSGMKEGGLNDLIVFAVNHGGFNDMAMKSHGNGGFFVSLFNAFSRGRLSLRSADPFDDPVLDPRMLSDERDLLRMRSAARHLFRLGRERAVTDIVECVTVGTTGRSLEDFPSDDDSALDDWLLRDANDVAHSAGTCRMGSPADPMTVVDPDCRVVGLGNLRVADASIMPADCRANLHLTVVMIGEHVAAKMTSVSS